MIESLTVNMLDVSYYLCDATWDIKNVNTPFSRLYYITSGQGYVTLDGQKHVLLPGKFYLIPCYSMSDYKCYDSMGHIYVHFTALIDDVFDLMDIYNCHFELDEKKSIQFEPYIKRLLEIEKKSNISEMLERTALIRLILSAFLKTDISDNIKLKTYSRFKPVLGYIDKHLKETLSVDELASLMELNPTYFSNLFTEKIGQSPIKYINQKRIERAQTYLWSTTDNLADIAKSVGIYDAFYFSKLFKKQIGMSPGAYRKVKRNL